MQWYFRQVTESKELSLQKVHGRQPEMKREISLGGDEKLECVEEFRYLGDVSVQEVMVRMRHLEQEYDVLGQSLESWLQF